MGDSSSEIVVRRANEKNFMFAFNDFDFSDRVLCLEIVPEPDNEAIDSDKKLRGEKYHERFSCIQSMHSKDSESCDGVKVITLHISSPILATESPFFYKLFKNGMRESQQKNDVSLRIKASEEATLMDLLKFMYGNTNMSATSAPDLVDLLIAADKFEVTSCMRYCIEMLLKLPMSLESALFYLELPSSVSVSEIVKPLIDAARLYVVAHYRNFTEFQKEAMELPLSAVEVVLGIEGLQVVSEDDVFDFILKWARVHYPELEERREILTKRLVKLICFPNMSSSKLKEVLVCPDFDHEHVSKLVMEALFSKVEQCCGQHVHASVDRASGFSFRSAASASASASAPASTMPQSPQPSFAVGSNNNQMKMDNTMAEDSMQQNQAPAFGSFSLGTGGNDSSDGGSFSLGTGGDDKSNRRIFKVGRIRNK